MTLPPGVRYSILRKNVEVPLIPVDQLPFHIQGLPCELTRFQKHQEGWKSIGETEQPAVPVSIRVPSNLHPGPLSACTIREFLPPDHDAHKVPVVVSQDPKPRPDTNPPSIAPAKGIANRLVSTSPAEPLGSMRTKTFATDRLEGVQYLPYRFPNPSGIEPDPSKKEFCTHWIRTNSCDFMQQGCKYKHKMPDCEKLKELGFAEIPKWYRDKMAISAGISSWLRPRTIQNKDDRQLLAEPSASRAFRPSILGLDLGHNQSRAVEMPGSPVSKIDQAPAESPNLIDLDDFSMAIVSLAPSLPISSSPGTTSVNVNTAVAQTSEQINKTLASSLRQKELKVKMHAKAPVDVSTPTTPRVLGRQKDGDALLVADAILTNDFVESSARILSCSVVSGRSNGRETNSENNTVSEVTKRGTLIAKSSAVMGVGGKRKSKSSRPQQKRNPRLRKIAECAASSPAPDGSASSQARHR